MNLVTCPYCGGTGEGPGGVDCPACYLGYVPDLFAEHMAIPGDAQHRHCDICGYEAECVQSSATGDWMCVRCFAEMFAPGFASAVHEAREQANRVVLQGIADDARNPGMVREWALRQLGAFVPVRVIVPQEVPA